MAPATRAASNTTVVTDASNQDTGSPSLSTTPRKVPHCSKCKRPRAGHPRTGCPFVESESGSAAPSPNNSPRRSASSSFMDTPDNSAPVAPRRTTGRRSIGSNNIVTAMGSMYIGGSSPPQETEEQIKAVIRDRTRRKSQQAANSLQGLRPSDSLRSLSTTSGDIVDMLLQPGILDEETEPEDEGNMTGQGQIPLKGRSSRVVQWQETIRVETTSLKPTLKKPKSSPQSPMPGTLITPNASFFESQSTVEGFNVKQEEGHGPKVLFTSSGRPSAPRPLRRSMSSEQRHYFLSQLGGSSKAQVHVLPKSTVYDIAQEAIEMGFIAEVAHNGDEESDEAFLVVGKDQIGVQKLVRRVAFVGQEVTASTASTKATNATPAATSSGGSNFRAVAGGAVVGAVGAWAGLAFS